MPLPVAHGLLGATVVVALQPSTAFNLSWKELLLAVLLGICPDFDYALNLIPSLGGVWHHGFTHSFVFAFVLGISISLVRGQFIFNKMMVYSRAVVSDPLLDYLFTESLGVELFWPFSNVRLKLQIPNLIDYSLRTTSGWETLIDLFKIILIELIIFAPILLIVLWAKQMNRRRSSA